MRSVVSGLALVLCFAGCEQKAEEKKKDEPKAEPSAASTSASLNPEIARAVAAAAKTKKDPAANDNGPPPNGILAAARADSEAPKAQAAKLVLGGTGGDPKVLLGGTKIEDKSIGQMDVSVRLGPRSALPSASFKFTVNRKESEDGSGEVSVNVKEAGLSRNQPGQVPPEVAGIISKLKGSRLEFETQGDKAVSFPRYVLSKTGPEQMVTLLSSTADALGHLIAPLPEEPVGPGAFWMTTSRETYAGTDSVAYRMVKVTELSKERAVLDVETRRYAATERLGLPDIEPNTLLQFQSNDKGQLVYVPGHALPVEGRVEMGLGALLDVNGTQRPVQIQTRALFSFPPKAQ